MSPTNDPIEPEPIMYEPIADEKPSEAVVKYVAETRERSPLELEPLYDTIDPDALDNLLDASDGDAPPVSIVITYGGCEVTVEPTRIRVDQPDG